MPPEPSGALRRPLPRRVSVSDAFATPSWDYDFFSIFLVFLSAPIAKRKRRHIAHAPPEPRGRAIAECTVLSVDPDSRPLMAHVSLQSCSLTEMSQVSRCTRHGMAAACGCAGHVHICVVRSWVRYDDAQTHQWFLVALPNAKTSKLYYVLPYVVHRFHRSGLAVAVPAECLAGLLLG